MRISINAKKIDGPYGGVNQFVNTLEKYLISKSHTVYRTLVSNLDIILIVSSKKNLKTTSYDIESIVDYKIFNPKVVVVQRINTCDEQRGNNLGINSAVITASKIADYIIYVSDFIRNVFINNGVDEVKPYSVILNAADEETFNPHGRANWQNGEKLRIVTHHWSSNFMKGFDIYERLDQLLDVEPFKKLFQFTIIGNIPLGIKFKNTTVIPPTFGINLAKLLKQNHIYLTAARNEPGPNHCAEAIQCGLPILYLNSGALPEYCSNYGLGFNLTNFEEKLMEMYKLYHEFSRKVLHHDYCGTKMAMKYEELFCQLLMKNRTLQRNKFNLFKYPYFYLIRKPYRKFERYLNLMTKIKKYL